MTKWGGGSFRGMGELQAPGLGAGGVFIDLFQVYVENSSSKDWKYARHVLCHLVACLRTQLALGCCPGFCSPPSHSSPLAGSILSHFAVWQRCASAGLRSTFHSASQMKGSPFPSLIWKIPGRSWVRLGPLTEGQRVLRDSLRGRQVSKRW